MPDPTDAAAPPLQRHLPEKPWMHPATARLPGIQPLQPGDWLRCDEAFAGQMAERDRLIATCPGLVHALPDSARPAAEELLDRVLDEMVTLPGFVRQHDHVTRPDGVGVSLDRSAPLLTLGRLVQEDFCLLQQPAPDGAEHLLTGAILCFPASWTLAEKIGRPLTAIHTPVPSYDPQMARRVQRLFDAIRLQTPLWRANAMLYAAPDLFQPRREADPRPRAGLPRPWLRSERQCLLRLPRSGAVVFSIHTYVLHESDLDPAARAALAARDAADDR